jgi:hypothetical protein
VTVNGTPLHDDSCVVQDPPALSSLVSHASSLVVAACVRDFAGSQYDQSAACLLSLSARGESEMEPVSLSDDDVGASVTASGPTESTAVDATESTSVPVSGATDSQGVCSQCGVACDVVVGSQCMGCYRQQLNNQLQVPPADTAADENAYFEALAQQGNTNWRPPTLLKKNGHEVYICGEADVDTAFLRSFGVAPLVITCKDEHVPSVQRACQEAGCAPPMLYNFGYHTRATEFWGTVA